MIKLATVFSGIGAIEHALKRMGIEHKIVFACDNGDVDILSKKIDPDLDKIDKELIYLKDLIRKIKIELDSDEKYIKELNSMLVKTTFELNELNKVFDSDFNEHINNSCKIIGINVVKLKSLKKSRKKEYVNFLEQLDSSNKNNNVLGSYRLISKAINDFNKDHCFNDFETSLTKDMNSDDIIWNNIFTEIKEVNSYFEKNKGKKILRMINDICERTSMLHEKINSFHILKELSQIKDYNEKKAYIDNLYAEKKSKNKVKESYMENYNLDEENYHWNISFLDGKQYENQVDLFVGGSPCQSFSLVGKQRGLEDTRGTLFYEYARLIKEIHPKVFIYENVKAILSNDDGKTWSKMREIFDELGYNVYYTMDGKPSVLNAKNYGIPQNRERMFVVGFRNDLVLKKEFKYPKPIKLERKLQDFLVDNVSGRYYLPKKGVDFVTSEKNIAKKFTQIDGEIQLCQKKNQQFNWHGDFVFEEENVDENKTKEDLEKYFLSEKVRKYVLSTGTKGFYSRPKTDLEVARPLLTTMHKMHRAGVDNYVTTDGRLRKLTPRECLRLMGFCDSFKIVVSDTAAYQQAGNSIVVDVLIFIMKSILESYPNLIG